MKKCFLCLVIILVNFLSAFAQKNEGIVTGKLTDTLRRQGLEGATVSLVSAKDSSLVSFMRTDNGGNFSFKNVSSGSYRISASFSGFYPAWKTFTLTGSDPVDLGEITMRDKSVLEEVVVNAEVPPVTVNGDTLEFNAGSFYTKPNAVVEDLLKKMPGMQVDKDGVITVNGQRINKVYVNGKEFFTGDPKLATKNLAADAVDKVQVFEKTSDQSAFTGFNDGNSETAINLKLKKNKLPTFGKVNAGVGTGERYDGQFNVNNFKGDRQLSAIGMANNTNRQGFSLMDILNFTGETSRMMKGGGGGRIIINTGDGNDFGLPVQGGGAARAGISKTIAGGLNYSDTWNKRTDFNSSYFYNNITVASDQQLNRQYVLPVDSYNYFQNSTGNRSTESNRINLSYDHRIDTFNSIKYTPSFTHQKNTYDNESIYRSYLPGGRMLNTGLSNSHSTSEGDDIKNNILFRHRFAKKGRTLSVNATFNNNESRSGGNFNSVNNFYTNGNISSRDTLDQQNTLKSVTQSFGTNLTYTEPLSKKTLVELNGFFNINTGNLNKETWDFNRTNFKYDKLNTVQSNAFENRYAYTGGGGGIRNVGKKYSLGIAANLQYASLMSKLKDGTNEITQHFTNLLPSANFTYNIARMKTFKMDYYTSTRQPTTAQLQPVKDISDRLNIRAGNPELKQEYLHNASLQYFAANPALQKNVMAFINFTATQNAIVNADDINSQGVRTTHPVNTDGLYNVFGAINWGTKIKKMDTRFTLGTNVFYTNNVNFINNERNNISSLSLAPRATLNYTYKEIVDITAEARISYNQVKYGLQQSLNSNYWQQQYSMDATVNLPLGFGINSDIGYTANTGRSTGYNTSATLWNAAITKEVFKNKKGEFKFSVNDILKQNIGVSRNANQNYIEDVTYRSLRRYYLLSFTYSLLKQSNNGMKVQMHGM